MNKRLPTIEEQADSLVKQSEDAARHYILSLAWPPSSSEQVRDALVYGYILAHLTAPADTFWQKEIVGAAMKQRFGITEEDFATSILGG